MYVYIILILYNMIIMIIMISILVPIFTNIFGKNGGGSFLQ